MQHRGQYRKIYGQLVSTRILELKQIAHFKDLGQRESTWIKVLATQQFIPLCVKLIQQDKKEQSSSVII